LLVHQQQLGVLSNVGTAHRVLGMLTAAMDELGLL
jgi:hypothetical protein